jgi:hypothetical protein
MAAALRRVFIINNEKIIFELEMFLRGKAAPSVLKRFASGVSEL